MDSLRRPPRPRHASRKGNGLPRPNERTVRQTLTPQAAHCDEAFSYLVRQRRDGEPRVYKLRGFTTTLPAHLGLP